MYVYDGIPDFIGNDESLQTTTMLAALCGYGIPQPIQIVSDSGFMVIFFEGNTDSGKIPTYLYGLLNQLYNSVLQSVICG